MRRIGENLKSSVPSSGFNLGALAAEKLVHIVNIIILFPCQASPYCCTVHNMNDKHERDQDPYRSFLLMDEIAKEEHLSQRALAQRLGISLGLVNSYLKNLVAKGCVRVKAFPKKRYTYLLTPKGLAEKSRLAYQHLSHFNNIYKIAREEFRALFRTLESEGVKTVVFCGVDEVAEIAYLSLCETSISLNRVMDDDQVGKGFFGKTIADLSTGLSSGGGDFVVTSFRKRAAISLQLAKADVAEKNIHGIGEGFSGRDNVGHFC